MKGRMALAVIFAFVVFMACSSLLFAQAIAVAQLNGTVTDQSGGIVGGAQISLRNTGTNITYTATSNERGLYAIPNLPPGTYELMASYTGFANYRQTGIVLTVGQSATVDVGLQVAALGEKVVVTSEAPVIEPTKTEISQVVDFDQIQALPISGRLFTDFALLTPNVATSRTSLGTTITEFEVTQISFGGMRSFSNEITVDGADFVNTITGVQRATPPQDSVQEFRVVNSSFGTEYGRAVGGIVNIVTRSGTNELHGSLYNYLQNSATNARTILQPAPLPHTLRQNQFGAVLGGPIAKDKTFFFVNYEGKRRAESPTYPPSLVDNIVEIDAAKNYLGLSPEGCTLPPEQCTGSPVSYLQSFLKSTNNDYGFARFDHQINSNNRLALRYIVEDARDRGELVGQTLDGGGIGTPSGGRNLFVRDQSVVGTVDSVLESNFVNTAMFQYARRHYNFIGATGEPDLSIVGDLELGHNFGIYDGVYESRVEFSDSVSWVKGNHIVKFGFDGNYVWGTTNYPGFTPTRIIIPNQGCLNSFANAVNLWRTATTSQTYGTLPTADCPLETGAQGVTFLYYGQSLPRKNCPDLIGPCPEDSFYNGYIPSPATGGGFDSGWPNAFPTNEASNYDYELNHGYWGLFIQDQWRITPKLTLNYGLRWDYESGLGIQIEPYYRAFQPRVGIAYAPDSKTVIRAGYGLFFDRNNLSFFYIPGGQKTVPGYLCYGGNDPSCNGVTPVKMPMVRDGAENAGWQLGGLPGFPATPSLPCSALGLPDGFCTNLPGGTISVASLTAFGILGGGPYPPSTLSGICAEDGTGACGVGAGGVDRFHGQLPYAHQASLQIDRQFGKGFALQLGYLFVGAHRLVRGNNINVPCPAGTSKPENPDDVQGWVNPDGTLSPCSGTPTLGPLGLGPIFNPLSNPTGLEFGGLPFNSSGLSAGLLDYNNNVVNAVYHGLMVTGIEKWGDFLSLTANYTYSHTIDNGNFTTFINLPPNQFDYSAERGNSNQDLRHHLVLNFMMDGPKDSFLRNFRFSSIITAQSGRPFTIYAGQNVLGDLAGSNTDRTGGPPVVPHCTSVHECSTLVGRNTYLGPPLYSWDLRISRAIQLTGRLKLDLAMDMFNVLNRANIDEVTSVYGPVFCGSNPVIPKHYNDETSLAIQNRSISCATQQAASTPSDWLALGMIPLTIKDTPNPNFGKARTVFNPRQFQFAARFTF